MVRIGEKRHGYFALSAFRSISFVHGHTVHKRARVSFRQSSPFRCSRWIRPEYSRPPLKTKRAQGVEEEEGYGGREVASRSFRHAEREKTWRNETLPNAVFSEHTQPQHTAQLCPLSSLIHRAISFPLRPLSSLSFSLSIPNLFPGGFDFV